MLPKIFVESNLTIVKDYESDVNPYSLTEADWNNEIDVLVEILVKINENQQSILKIQIQLILMLLQM